MIDTIMHWNSFRSSYYTLLEIYTHKLRKLSGNLVRDNFIFICIKYGNIFGTRKNGTDKFSSFVFCTEI